jgi:cytochrome P450
MTTMTVTNADLEFDLYDRELYASPYATYRRLRDECPLYYNEEHRYYAVSRFDDVIQVLGDREVFSSANGSVYPIAISGMPMPEGLFIAEDPPQHTVHRALVSRLFTPRAMSRIEPDVRALFDGAARALRGESRFDFVKDFANMLPIQVIGMLLGLPESDYADLRDAFHRSQNEATADRDHDALSSIAEAAVWFTQYLDFRAEHPTDDLMTQLLNTEFEDETGTVRLLRRDELNTFLILITGAGSDTTVNAISWVGSLLGDHPDQLAMLQDDASLIPNALEEVLRYEAIPYHISRTTAADVELYGQTIPRDSIVITLPGSANRDERQHADPDRFDITRTPEQSLTFSFGPHHCLGASLARLEARLALEAALEHFGHWTIDHSGAVLTGGVDTRGWEHLPVVV